MNNPNKVEILYCYESEDDFGSYETGVEVVFDGVKVAEYGDYYHDKGIEKARGFIDGVSYALGRKLPKIKYREVVR